MSNIADRNQGFRFGNLKQMLRYTSTLSICAVMIVLHNPPIWAEQSDTILVGRVVNGTPGAAIPQGLQMVLLTIEESTGHIADRQLTTVGPNGSSEFKDVERSPLFSLRLVTEYNEVTEALTLNYDDLWNDVEVIIYETTTSFDDIHIFSYVLAIPSVIVRERVIGILGSIVLRNTGKETVVPDLKTSPPSLLRIALPSGYTHLKIESDLGAVNAQAISEGFALLDPITPGEHMILFQYVLNYDEDILDMPISLLYGAEQLRVLLKEEFGTVTIDGYHGADSAVIDDERYQLAQVNGYEPGTIALVSINGLPSPTLAESVLGFFDDHTIVIAVGWFAGLGMLIMLTYGLFWHLLDRKRATHRRAEVVQMIALLDEHYDGGVTSGRDYQKKRRDLKNQVLQWQPVKQKNRENH